LPQHCGENAGQHLYIEAGRGLASEAALTAVFTGTASRTWKIKVTQVLCSAGAPAGCYQYLTGLTGTVRSFNFLTKGTYLHLANQHYKVCIRREKSQCKIAWTQSSDPDSFKLSRPSTNFQSQVGSAAAGACSADSVKIPGGSNLGLGGCITPVAQATPVPSVDRYCGGTLTCQRASTFQSTIVTDRLPFCLEVDFSATEGQSPAATGEVPTNNRGFCLNYYQIPC